MPSMRSLLFVPGDSARKLEKSRSSGADIVIIDLEDSVAPQSKSAARKMALSFLTELTNSNNAPVYWVRVNPLDSGLTADDLDGIFAKSGAPAGIMLPKAAGPRDIQTLDAMLLAHEKASGLAAQSVPILPIVTETPAAAMTIHQYISADYAGRARLAALTWGAEDLSAAIGAARKRDDKGQWTFPYQMVRASTLMTAHALEVQAIDTLHADFRDEAGLQAAAQAARADGFTGMMAIHPAQVAIINAAFTPSDEELAYAKAVIAAFAAQPDAGVVSLDGKMLDLPHLKLAQKMVRIN